MNAQPAVHWVPEIGAQRESNQRSESENDSPDLFFCESYFRPLIYQFYHGDVVMFDGFTWKKCSISMG